MKTTSISYKKAHVDGFKIFYREAGDPQAPAVFYDTGHFVLETHAAEIGAEIRSFLSAIDND